ncbi:EAL domain-containing protein [Pseudolabrys taiwanensis]|uniref:EAL domain-containing protein n=1 Tax=Pseudolabrys taiwanensis TaxID=331696 RepID=A0A346A2T4_9HYPH|nr:EAL domain-containing protein [Pseudolabrys taiwanensis]AXK83481.1 EAL domain-containing protein [Pseudolabrys taiwanensis]
MRRFSAIFIAICMIAIAASVGGVLYLAFQVDAPTSAIVALAFLIGLALYNTISNRLRDRGELGSQIGDLSRGTADLARQVAELSRRLNAIETNVTETVNRARGAVDPIEAEINELGGLMRQLADTVATHEELLQEQGVLPVRPVLVSSQPEPVMPVDTAPEAPLALQENEAVDVPRLFGGMTREAMAEAVAYAVKENRIDLYLQPIVTLPQRKVRYYEAMSRLRTTDGDILPAADFIEIAELTGLMPKIDNLLAFRCVQVTRRLQLKSRDVGLFCNVSPTTLADANYFKQFLDFMEANRALAPALVFEFTQRAYRAFGAIEQESLAALAELGFRFSMDNVTDLRLEPKELSERGFRHLKVPAKLLVGKSGGLQTDIHPEDLADLLARYGIDLVAERIEGENMVVDLLDYDVRFGQGFLFSAPRPVRAEALQGSGAQAGTAFAAAS